VSDDLAGLVEAAQHAAGIVAARHRGDTDGARVLLADLEAERLAGGSLLLATLALGLASEATDRPFDQCVHGLSLDLQRLVDRLP